MISAELVKETAKKVGFDLVGITSANPLSTLAPLLQERQRQGKEPEFVSSDIEDRIDPKRFFPEVKSIIMVALNYYHNTFNGEHGECNFSRSAWGVDYHRMMRGMLEQMGQTLKQIEPALTYKSFVDTGPLVERELARRAGLGWIGKNASLITPEFGSWVFLGGMAINFELEEDSPVDKDCGNCRKCIDACPAGALEEAYCVNPSRCLSYVSQRKGYLTAEERELLQNRLYGCDTCQEVCPINVKLAKDTTHKDLKPLNHLSMSLAEIASMDNSQFKARLATTAAAWRGKTNLKRNAIIALANSGDPRMAPILKSCLDDPSPVIRGYAAWALGKLPGDRAEVLQVLENALAGETDAQVKEEIAMVLDKLQ